MVATRSADWLRTIGADHAIDYAREDFSRARGRYDAILDLVGTASIASCQRALRSTGIYVSSVGRAGWSLRALFASFFARPRVAVLAAHSTAADLRTLRELIESGAVTPRIDREYPLHDAPEALRQHGEGHARGKSVITI